MHQPSHQKNRCVRVVADHITSAEVCNHPANRSAHSRESHGGANLDDRNAAVLISNPALTPVLNTALVQTTQVAPTILKALGLDPSELQSVKIEGTEALPALPF